MRRGDRAGEKIRRMQRIVEDRAQIEDDPAVFNSRDHTGRATSQRCDDAVR